MKNGITTKQNGQTKPPPRSRAEVNALRELFGRDALMINCKYKKPVGRWRELTIEIMEDEGHLVSLGYMNIGIVNGEKSNGLCCIDVDEEKFIEVLLKENPFLRNTTQTKGHRGCHYWFRLKGNHTKITNLKYMGENVGEFRSTGLQTVIAGKHPEGCDYKILNKVKPIVITFDQLWLPNKQKELKLTDDTERSDEGRVRRRGLVSLGCVKKPLTEEFIITRSLPTSPRKNHISLFELARGVRGLEAQLGCSFSPREHEEIFDRWLQCNSYLRKGRSREDYYFEYVVSLEGVQFPLAQEDVLQSALDKAQSSTPPPEVSHYDNKKIILLASLCRELQIMAGDKPFFLSCRSAASLVGHKNYKTVILWLQGLSKMNNPLLKVTNRGGPHSNKANRYRYLGTLERKLIEASKAVEVVR